MNVLGDRSRIQLVSEDTFQSGGSTFNRTFFRNAAYRCGRTGNFTFVVIERSDTVRQTRPLWVRLHGGGTGYYDASGRYHGVESFNDEESASQLTGYAADAIEGARFADNVLGRRLAEGYRLLIPSMCDHDLYAGTGQAYPNNSHGDAVEGLSATTAALHFMITRRNGDGSVSWPTSLVFFHGSSAGSAGAWNVGSSLARAGIRINGALLDSYVITRRSRELVAVGCSPVNNEDPEFVLADLEEKIGPTVTDESLFIESSLPPPFPIYDLEGDQDPFCCGHIPAVAPARQLGYTSNCAWLHGRLIDGMTSLGPTVRAEVVPGRGHVIAGEVGPHQEHLETWLRAILATEPDPPVFPP